MKRILITGGAGFVGTHLVNELSKDENIEIVVFDNLFFGSRENIPIKNNVIFFEGDVRNKTDLRNAFKDVDIIIHLAAIVSVTVCEQKPDFCYENNVIGTRNVFEIAQEFGITKIIYASSAAVYGNLSSSQIMEMDATIPISQYGKTKYEKEIIAKEFSNTTSSIGLRFFNIYGPGLSMENAYPSVLISFFKKIKEGLPIIVYGDGTQTRDFIHVYDIVDAIKKTLDNETAGADIYNVGTGYETTILELAEKIRELNPDVQIQFENARDFDIAKSCADISKIKENLNFTPTRKVIEDIESLIALYISKL